MSQSFALWLEFEAANFELKDPSDEGFNAVLQLSDGRRYGYNIWTFGCLERLRRHDASTGENLAGAFIVPPDLLVARADRGELERVFARLIETDRLAAHLLVSNRPEQP